MARDTDFRLLQRLPRESGPIPGTGYQRPAANETAEGTAVDPVVAVAYDRAVDVAGDNRDKRVAGCFECLLTAGASSSRKAISRASP